MRLLQDGRLRYKFLVITGIAFLVPFLFNIAFLGLCLVSIGEIEKQTLSNEVLEVEALLRGRLGHLERTAHFLKSRIDSGEITSAGLVQSTQTQFFNHWFDQVSRLDFAVLQRGEMAIPLYQGKQRPGRTSQNSNIVEILKTLKISPSGSGLIQCQGVTYLVYLSSIPDGSSSGSLLVGLDLEQDLLFPVSLATGGHFAVTEIPREQTAAMREAAWIAKDVKGNTTFHRALPGAAPGTLFDLQYTFQAGLFDQLRTRLVWFPTFLLGAVLISSLLGTAWATTTVLKPLKRMSQSMAAVAGPEDYATRIPEDSTDEIGELATSFNRLMARLEEAQQELEEAQKTRVEAEKVATLHATVITLAHQINNPLAALVGQAELLLLDTKTPAKMRKSLEVIRGMGLRIAEVIKQLELTDTVHTTAYLSTQDMVQIEIHTPTEPKQAEDPVHPKKSGGVGPTPPLQQAL